MNPTELYRHPTHAPLMVCQKDEPSGDTQQAPYHVAYVEEANVGTGRIEVLRTACGLRLKRKQVYYSPGTETAYSPYTPIYTPDVPSWTPVCTSEHCASQINAAMATITDVAAHGEHKALPHVKLIYWVKPEGSDVFHVARALPDGDLETVCGQYVRAFSYDVPDGDFVFPEQACPQSAVWLGLANYQTFARVHHWLVEFPLVYMRELRTNRHHVGWSFPGSSMIPQWRTACGLAFDRRDVEILRRPAPEAVDDEDRPCSFILPNVDRYYDLVGKGIEHAVESIRISQQHRASVRLDLSRYLDGVLRPAGGDPVQVKTFTTKMRLTAPVLYQGEWFDVTIEVE